MTVYQITNDVAEASGVGTFVRGLDAALRAQGVDSRIVTDLSRVEHVERNHGIHGRHGKSGGGWIAKGDVVHIHGLWLGLHRQAFGMAKAAGVKVVWSTHGMTAPWAMRFKWWKKWPAWWLYQRRMLKAADVVHVTTEQEKEWNVRLGIEERKIVVVPLGCNV